MRSVVSSLRQFGAALRILLAFTVLFGVGYPLFITAVAQVPGLRHAADGSTVSVAGHVLGSTLLGQNFTDSSGAPLPQYFQSRPSAAGSGYDPTASGASNLGPESIVDTLADPAVPGDTGKQSLLTQVCARSRDLGRRYGVDGSRPFCTSDGVGAVLAVFHQGPGYRGPVTRVVSINQEAPGTPFLATYQSVRVELGRPGTDYSTGQIIAVRGDASADPAVPADAVTASGSGLDPDISPAYARLQEALVARARHISGTQIAALVAQYSAGRDLGFLGEPRVAVLPLNLALDRLYPTAAR